LKKTNSKNWKITRYSDNKNTSTSIFRLRDLGWRTIVVRYKILSGGDAAGRNDDITSEDVVCRRIYNVELVYNVVLYM